MLQRRQVVPDKWSAPAGRAKALSDGLKAEVTHALAELAQWHVQSGIDGASNIWILKPGGKSRGRGISCTNTWADIKVCRSSVAPA